MTPEPALWNLRGPSSGWSKKRRKKGSSSSGLALRWLCLMVPWVEMFTTAGDTCLIIGDSDGTGVSPTTAGIAACAGTTGAVRNAAAASGAMANCKRRRKEARDMVDSGRAESGAHSNGLRPFAQERPAFLHVNV